MEPDECVSILSEEVIDTSVFRPEDAVCFKANVCIYYLQSGMKRRQIERSVDDVTEDEQMSETVTEEDVVFVAQKTAHHLMLLPVTPRLFSLKHKGPIVESMPALFERQQKGLKRITFL